ncbi:WXG100-like domain-containing protein [Nocardia australiensis]|uniref:WXG100-like domain-containing protein n=1 Tax=Nocardia australiensis TaxID=2887191 RepID=UPI001D14B9B2|nr:hypothetical protein [Nocardia australiensis]
MGLQIPPALRPVAAVVVYRWPKADETKLFRLGNLFEKKAVKVDRYRDKVDAKVEEALGHIEGKTHDAIEEYRKKVNDALDTLVELLHGLALALKIYAALVLAIKLYIIAMLIYTAAQLAIAAAAAAPTLGASAAEAAAMQAAVKAAVTAALRKLITQILTQTVVRAAIGAGRSASLEFIRQTVKIEFGRQNGYDTSRLAYAAERGGLTGGVQGALNKLGFDPVEAKKLGTQLSQAVLGTMPKLSEENKPDHSDDSAEVPPTPNAPSVEPTSPQHAPYVDPSQQPSGEAGSESAGGQGTEPSSVPAMGTSTPVELEQSSIPDVGPVPTQPSSLDLGQGDTFNIEVRVGSSLDL